MTDPVTGPATGPDPELLAEMAPTGPLRVAINYGNVVLAQEQPDGTPGGVSVDLARALAARLGLEPVFATYPSAGRVTDALADEPWDLAFLADDPLRAERARFSAPYVLIEGTYLVAAEAAFEGCADVDADGVRVAVGTGTAYDLHLTRTVERAELVRFATSPDALAAYLAGETDVAAGVRQPLELAAEAHPGHRVLPDRFTAIRQAMAVPRGRDRAAAHVEDFLAQMIASGFVADALVASGQDPGLVA